MVNEGTLIKNDSFLTIIDSKLRFTIILKYFEDK